MLFASQEPASGAIFQTDDPFVLGARRTAENHVVMLNPMADDAATAMTTRRC